MSSKDFKSLCIFFLMLSLNAPTLQLNWQGTGNMSDSNMTEIHNVINNNPITSATSPAQIDDVAQAISTQLNTLWATAWNVAILKNGLIYDAVVYGYAFRNHWMWINGVTIVGDTANKLTYIIWKDYNCQNWITVGSARTGGSTFTSQQQSAIGPYSSFSGITNDVWGKAYSFSLYLDTRPALNTGAYAIIMNMNPTESTRGYFCMVNRNYYTASNLNFVSPGVTAGSYFLFQTR